MLRAKNLNVFYGDIQILNQICIDIARGEKVCLVGNNGAGKTTFLKTLCGLLRPKFGEIIFLDKRIDILDSSKIVEMGLIRVPEGRLIFPLMTILENLELGAYNPRAKGSKAKTLKKIFDFFPILYERKGQVAGTLSGGEQQMLAIGRALMSLPLLLLMDEPSLGLGPLIVKEIFDIVKKINKEGVTILLVEQNVQYSLRNCDRGYIFENGQIVLDGQARELLGNELVRKAYLGL